MLNFATIIQKYYCFMRPQRKAFLYYVTAIAFTLLITGSLITTGCRQKAVQGSVVNGDSLLTALEPEWEVERILQLCDSLEQTGTLTPLTANYYRARAYTRYYLMQEAEQYLKEALDIEPKNITDRHYHLRALTLMVDILDVRHNFEQMLLMAMPELEAIDWSEIESDKKCLIDAIRLVFSVGFCQAGLTQYDEAEESFQQAITRLDEAAMKDDAMYEAIWGFYRTGNLQTVCISFLNAYQYQRAKPWVDRYVEAANRYAAVETDDPETVDEQLFASNLLKAITYQKLGQTAEAAEAYERCMQTQAAENPVSRFNASNYLLEVGRYDEAAEFATPVEEICETYGMAWTIDNIKDYMAVKFKALYGAGQRDSALAVANRLVSRLDSAIVWQNRDKSAELATIYDTQGKERQIAEQEMALSQQRFAGLVIALILITLFFIIYTLYRRKVAQRMAEMKAHQERMESELRIARDIQMSMVPSTFPQHEHLDMYASMVPAKEVGGDLYGYVINDDKLYFCVGDVSGKGVPASLFMAQATRLFRTLAAQQMMPADICNRINDALCEDNEQGMFVTMFIGLVDLHTGHLAFCNAGHNPPVVDCQFLSMIPNAPIGLWPGLDYEGEEIESINGKTIFIYTDGLNEAENKEQQQFGDNRLLNILTSNRSQDSRQEIETMTAEVQKHRAGAEPNDDLTMMCIRIH